MRWCFIYKMLRLNRDNIIKAVEIYGWRSKTSLPIIRIEEYTVSPETHPLEKRATFRCESMNNSSPNKTVEDSNINSKISEYIQQHPDIVFYQLRVRIEEIKCRLSDINMLPFSQAVYLLKEILIGFEVLIDIFGIFDPTELMVAVNVREHWKVWINDDFSLNSKQDSNITQKQFIFKLILMSEKHCLTSTQSKQFFNMLKEYSYSNECSFIRILEKTTEFVTLNKVYQVNKVTLPNDRIYHIDTAKKNINEPDRIASIKNNLKKLITPTFPVQQHKPIQKMPLGGVYQNKSVTNLINININNSSSQLITFPSSKQIPFNTSNTHHRVNTTVANFNPSSPMTNQSPQLKNSYSTFGQQTDTWQFKSADFGKSSKINSPKYETLKQLPLSPKISEGFKSYLSPGKNRPMNQTFMQSVQYSHPNIAKSTLSPAKIKQSTLNISPTKHRHEIRQLANEHKPIHRPQQTPKRTNVRKYSEQIIKMKSVDALANKQKKISGSSIYIDHQPRVLQIKRNISRQYEYQPIIVHTPTQKAITNESSSPEIKCISSPNNSSSTKELQNSGEVKNKDTNYMKLKINDLGSNRPKNNQSVINCYGISSNKPQREESRKDKNMAVSYQFHNRDRKDSDSELSNQKKQNNQQTKWMNKISGLFSDNVSIKHLKQSIKFKTKEEQIFQKEYLKDVKLDMLEKFGRNVNDIIEQDDGTPYLTPSSKYHHKHGQYKSMQLIEQELEEAKSYLEEDRKDDELPCKSIRSKNQTLHLNSFVKQKEEKDDFAQKIGIYPKECHSESDYDDNDMNSEIQSDNGGFNFQTEEYVINPSKPY